MNNKNLILSDRYELIRPLGQGECGSVFLVRQQSLEQYRAMKRFPKNTSAQPLFAISEAQILKSVQHPGIPTIYDFEEDESFYYLVEEYIQGDSLEEFLLHQQSISQNQFLYFCEQLCDIFAIAGGVASNGVIRAAMEQMCREEGVKFYHPSPILCTDNAAMIGAAAYYDFIAGKRAGLDLNAVPNLKLGE